MNEDDRKKYLEELMQPHIPLRVLQEIRQEIEDNVLETLSDGGDDWFTADKVNDCIEIIDKHIKEIES